MDVWIWICVIINNNMNVFHFVRYINCIKKYIGYYFLFYFILDGWMDGWII